MRLRTENYYSTLNSFLISRKRTVNFEIGTRNVITADYITIMLRTLKVTGNLGKFALFVLLPVSEEAKTCTEPWRGLCVAFSGKTLYSHSASLHPGVEIGTGELNAGGNPAMD